MGKPTNAAGEELRAVRVELTPAEHQELRIDAAKRDQSMAALVRTLIQEHLAKTRAGKK
jgi:hypothetical protein